MGLGTLRYLASNRHKCDTYIPSSAPLSLGPHFASQKSVLECSHYIAIIAMVVHPFLKGYQRLAIPTIPSTMYIQPLI